MGRLVKQSKSQGKKEARKRVEASKQERRKSYPKQPPQVVEAVPVPAVVTLEECESVIETGLRTFMDVGQALLTIRENKLYLDVAESFEAYCADRWGFGKSRAYQLMGAAQVAASLPDEHLVESHATVLKDVPEAMRGKIYAEAKRSAKGGRVTAAHLQQIADKRLGKTNGQSDPADIKRARLAGKIPAEAEVSVTEPDHPTSTEAVAEEHAEASAIADDVSDQDWLAGLPIREQLSEARRKWFDLDAMLWKHLASARDRFVQAARPALAFVGKKGGSKGPYAYRLATFFRIQAPAHWTLCPPPEQGGCGGTGELDGENQCQRCYGRGYTIL